MPAFFSGKYCNIRTLCTGTLAFSITVLDMTSFCKAQEGEVAVATLTDYNNVTADVIGSAVILIINLDTNAFT